MPDPTPKAARTPEQRKQDTLGRLEHDTDAWVATASGGDAGGGRGIPHLVPLSFLWDGESILISTAASSPTGRNLQATGRTRLGIGPTRDVVLIEGTAQALTTGDISAALGDEFAAKTGFDPRRLAPRYLYFRIRPQRIQAWREENELTGRELMRDGQWLLG